MTIYRLSLNTLCGTRVGDFSLPRVLGYFAQHGSAVDVRTDDIARRENVPINRMEWTDSTDYSIDVIDVKP